MSYFIRSIAALLIATATTAGAQARGAQPRTLGRPVAELDEPFSGIIDLRELSGGGLIVLDGKDNVLHVVTPALDGAQRISREGSGPTEYRRVTQLLARGGDSTLAYDIMNARFLVIDGRGVPTGTISLREASGGLPVGPAAVRGYDTGGRLFYQGIKFSMGKAGPELSDSMFILRLDPQSKRVDTLGHARAGAPGIRMSGDMQKGTGNVKVMMPAFPVVDEWGLMPDGRVVVVRGATYHLEFLGGAGGAKVLPPVPFTPAKVTEADKVKLRKQLEEAEVEMQKAAASAVSAAGRPGARMPGMAMSEPDEWPSVKPAFGQGALKIAPDGEVWIRRHREAKDEAPLYDVFSPAGALKFRVELPPKVTLVGFGPKHLYAVRVDDDELQYLAKYARP